MDLNPRGTVHKLRDLEKDLINPCFPYVLFLTNALNIPSCILGS